MKFIQKNIIVHHIVQHIFFQLYHEERSINIDSILNLIFFFSSNDYELENDVFLVVHNIKPIYDNDIGLIFLAYVVRMSFNYKLSKSINNATNMKLVDILSISRLLWGCMKKMKIIICQMVINRYLTCLRKCLRYAKDM